MDWNGKQAPPLLKKPGSVNHEYGIQIVTTTGLDVWFHLAIGGWVAKSAAKKLAYNAAVGMLEGLGQEGKSFHIVDMNPEKGGVIWVPPTS